MKLQKQNKKKAKRLNFGCGMDIREGWDNVDIQKNPELTKCFDFDKFPYPIKDNTYDYILVDNVLEHLDNIKKVLDELWRISKSQAEIKIIVPYYNNKGAYTNIQHIHYFSDFSFINFVENKRYINEERKFEIVELKLNPTCIGKIIFCKQLREKLSLFIGGLIADIHVKLKVKK